MIAIALVGVIIIQAHNTANSFPDKQHRQHEKKTWGKLLARITHHNQLEYGN